MMPILRVCGGTREALKTDTIRSASLCCSALTCSPYSSSDGMIKTHVIENREIIY
jgi:hypothetical protein